MTERLVIVGAGGFGRETIDVIRAQNLAKASPVYDLQGVLDSNPSDLNLGRLERLGVPYLGSEQDWLSRGRPSQYLVAIGDPEIRRLVSGKFDAAGCIPGRAIHPTAVIGSESTIGPGAVLCAGVQVSTNVRVGRHVQINPNVTVGHDAVLDDYVSLNPGSIVSGSVHCESQVLLGANAIILQGLRAGKGSVIGASACVTKDVAQSAVVRGVPAR